MGSSTLDTFQLSVMEDTDTSAAQTVMRVSRVGPASGLNVNTFLQVENYWGGGTTIAGAHLRLAFARGTRASPNVFPIAECRRDEDVKKGRSAAEACLADLSAGAFRKGPFRKGQRAIKVLVKLL